MRSFHLGVAAAATAILAGCAPAPSPSQPTAISTAPSTTSPLPGITSVPSSSTPAPSEHGSLAHCLHEHGVPDSAGSGVLGPPQGVDPGVWDLAKKACSPLEPGPAS
jgi:hypothetical protein